MDSSWKNSRRIFLVFPELSPLVKLRGVGGGGGGSGWGCPGWEGVRVDVNEELKFL